MKKDFHVQFIVAICFIKVQSFTWKNSQVNDEDKKKKLNLFQLKTSLFVRRLFLHT